VVSGKYLGDLYEFDPFLHQWSELSNFTTGKAPSARHFHGMASDEMFGLGRFFVMGGVDEQRKWNKCFFIIFQNEAQPDHATF
jgi:hypothetical protein